MPKTEPAAPGAYVMTPGSTLDIGDYVYLRNLKRWFRIAEQVNQVQNRVTGCVYTRTFRGVAQDGSRYVFPLDSRNVKAYRLHR